MLGFKKIWALCIALGAAAAEARGLAGRPGSMRIDNSKRAQLQNLVTFDKTSLFVRGERIVFFSGELHPYRLPVPGLWLDLFQKIRALGFTGASFYTSWASLEGTPGKFRAEGIFNFDDFFNAASKAGIYLLARPGPYINAEATGGGFPGWLQRNPATLRTSDKRYLDATNNYVANMAGIIAKYQITNGGPVILYQPENEYTQAASNVKFPDVGYFQYVMDQARKAGIVVPLISNDAYPTGVFSPDGKQSAKVDIYGHDGYPLGFNCANPGNWGDGSLPDNFRAVHMLQAPSTPFSLVEYQGGSFDPWGGSGFDKCLSLVNHEFERVFYKNAFAAGVTIFNLYMTYGGTNWGNQGHPGGYTSYDYGASIAEDLTVAREKYSEIKLEANFLTASPDYLVAIPQSNGGRIAGVASSSAINVLQSSAKTTNFYVVRHAKYNSLDTDSYTFTVTTSKGKLTIPQLGGSLSLSRRDSKFHVTDYDLGGTNLLYSSAEIFTWKKYADKTVLVVYGGPKELHELAIETDSKPEILEGDGLKTDQRSAAAVVQFTTSTDRRVVKYGTLYVYILDRNSAYNFWTVDLPSSSSAGSVPGDSGNSTTGGKNYAIINAGYLIRNASVSSTSFSLTGDVNRTTTIEVIGGAPAGLTDFRFNGAPLQFKQNASTGVVTATVEFKKPTINIPDLSAAQWKSIDSLPELSADYDDKLWTAATLTTSNNTFRKLSTPTSLYSSDYGFHTGPLVYRGHFTAKGGESSFKLSTQGGSAFGASAWLGSTFLGSFGGNGGASWTTQTFNLPSLTSGTAYVLTVVVDVMGLEQNYTPGQDTMKNPRGIMDYTLAGHAATDVTWKLTGNLGGEAYRDLARGPLNEGGLYFERQGYHLPDAPTTAAGWTASSTPMNGTAGPGVRFYATTFDLDVPDGYHLPIAVSFGPPGGGAGKPFRAQLYVNGYQYGKYVHNIGPQSVFPVPRGIWNYEGSNYLGVMLWSMDNGGASLPDLKLVAGEVVQTGYGKVTNSPHDGWVKRDGAY